MNIPGLNNGKLSKFFLKPSDTSAESMNEDHTFYSEHHFHHMLHIERKRTERSKKPFLLMLLDISRFYDKQQGHKFETIKSALVACSRETDIRGWYEPNKVMGAIFTEMASIDESAIEKIFRKLHGAVCENLDAEWVKRIKISVHVFPEENGQPSIDNGIFNVAFYPDLS